MDKASDHEDAVLEFELHKRVQRSKHACRAVPCVHACFDAGDKFHIVMDAMEGGSVEALLAGGQPMAEDDAKALMRRLLDGIDVLHSLDIAHNDIKPANLMLRRPGDLDSLCLIDLGLASDLRRSAWMDTACGSPLYFAPELVKAATLGTAYSQKVDIWAAGVVMYYLLCGELPFHGATAKELFTKILAHTGKLRGAAVAHLSEPAAELLASLLHPSPHKRATARQALRHPWFAGERRHGRFGTALARKLEALAHWHHRPAPSASTKACQDRELARQVSNHLAGRLSQSVQAH